MENSRIEIKVSRDANHEEVHIESMSFSAAKSFSIIFDSILMILEHTPGCEDAKIKLVKGSALAVVEAPNETIELLYKGFEETRTNQSTNKGVVSGWLSIQKLIKENGLDYEATFYKNNQTIPVAVIMKSSKLFRTQSLKTRPDTCVLFLRTKLIEVGGKKPNIHFLGENDEKITAICSHEDALRANQFLYNEIRLSVWKTEKENTRPVYECCDVYMNDTAFDEIRLFIDGIEEQDDVALLMELHREIKQRLEVADELSLRRVSRIMQIYSHPDTDINKLKTILLVTKSFKDKDEIKGRWQLLNDLYNKAYKKL